MTALYVHIPYCKSKCLYCDFDSVPLDGSVDAYLRALAKEAARASQTVPAVETVYIGGGTPTVLTPDEIRRLFECLRENFDIPSLAEVTVEANPCSLTPAKATALVASSVNRVSLGAQSFVDAELSLLGRSHDTEDTLRCFSLLREAGIDNMSLDLMYAIPNQSEESWRHSLARATELKPEHISTYCLTYEPGTPLWRLLQSGEIEKKSDDDELELYEIARETFSDAGYEHYEISNFALPCRRSLHNTVYWSNEEYLSLGASAVSYLDATRTANLRGPRAYTEAMESRGDAAVEVEKISPRMQAVETIIQRLRLREGIDCASFERRFGAHPGYFFGRSLPSMLELGLIEQRDGFMIPSIAGWHLANEVALRCLP